MARVSEVPPGPGSAALPRDVLITGLPRSGTTLLVHLLDKLPGTVALDEPMDARAFLGGTSAGEMADGVARFLCEQRRSIVERRMAITFHAGGKVPDNPVGAARDASGKRTNRGVEKGEIRIEKDLPADFLLAVKHNAAFTALLEPLAKRFETFAAVRNPLSVLASWNSVSLPVGRGHVPTAEAIDKELARDLAAIDDVVGRQIRILDWFCTRFRDAVPADHVIRYEDVVETGGRALSVVTPLAASLDEKLKSKNRNDLYDAAAMREIGRRLIGTEGAYWHFYTRESVEELIR